MPICRDLLSRGFFPKELPEFFTGLSFERAITRNREKLPADFRSARTAAALGCHNLARPGGLRRRLGLPNPLPFVRLCDVVNQHWRALEQHCQQSRFSTTTPLRDPRGLRALIPKRGLNDAEPRAVQRGAARFVVRADISQCYASIYTHAIPWALHTKATAKKNRTSNLAGNVVDQAVRNCNDQQTKGIPIGPDTSLLVAEIILSAVDIELQNRHPTMRATRKMDDYEIVAASNAEADEYLNSLQEVLADFDLNLNGKKSEIQRLPLPLQPQWVRDFRCSEFGVSPAIQRTRLLDFFDELIQAARDNPTDSVINYGLAILRRAEIDSSNWDLLLSLVCQAVTAEPGAIAAAHALVMGLMDIGFVPNSGLLSELVHSVIAHEAPLGHASEVAWALRMVLQGALHLDEDATSALGKLEDDVVACLALDAHRRKLLTRFSLPQQWACAMTEEALFGEHWLLAYEANVKGWIRTPTDHVRSVPAFAFLKAEGVGFYGISVAQLSSRLSSAIRRKKRKSALVNSGKTTVPTASGIFDDVPLKPFDWY